jgi:hypothetical protein
MITVDYLLKHICQNIKVIDKFIPTKDKKILTSLDSQLDQGNFLTENQAKLLVKILAENIDHILLINDHSQTIIDGNTWTHQFRTIQQVRKIYISNTVPSSIKLEFTYDKRIKTKLAKLNGLLDGNLVANGPRHYSAVLTEKNIVALVNEFKNDRFEIDEKIMNFYHEISEILENKKSPFRVFSLENENLKKHIEDDVGPITIDNLLLLHDRKFRYQYTITEKITEKSLKNSIAQRSSTKIFVNSQQYPLDELLASLKDLLRLPLLCVFDGHDAKVDKKMLNLLSNAMIQNNVDNQTGIYFRFDQGVEGDQFNKSVKDLKYNQPLTEVTTVAGIANNKIPKFMVKSGWKPKTVISLIPGFKNNKSSVYFSDVDLIIYYGDKKPLAGDVDVIV